ASIERVGGRPRARAPARRRRRVNPPPDPTGGPHGRPPIHETNAGFQPRSLPSRGFSPSASRCGLGRACPAPTIPFTIEIFRRVHPPPCRAAGSPASSRAHALGTSIERVGGEACLGIVVSCESLVLSESREPSPLSPCPFSFSLSRRDFSPRPYTLLPCCITQPGPAQ